jgi:hypothetical protein
VKHQHPLAGLVLALFLALSLAACGGTSNPPPNPTDKTAPTLSSSLPPEGASAVPINAKLALAFSEAMDEASLELTSNPAVTLGTVNWNAESTSVVFDNDTLAVSTGYTVTIKAKDVSGNALTSTTLTFTTSDVADTTAPSVPTGLVATPANGQVTLTWQANPETDVVGYTLYVGTTEDALESKEFLITNSTTVTNLTNGTSYFFAIDAVDAANNHSSQTAPVSATPSTTVTDTTAPTIQSSNPADGATDVSGEFSFHLVFSEPMDRNSLIFDLDPAEFALELITWSENDTVLDVSPLQLHLFSPTTSYRLSLSVKDKAGNPLSGDTEINFTTGEEAPTLVSSTPENGATDVPVEKFEISLVFSKPMDAATFTVEPTLEPVDISNYSQGWTLTWNAENTVLTITTTIILPGYFLEDTTYTLLLTGKSKTGTVFADTTLSFKTVTDTTQPTVTETSPVKGATNVPLSPLDVFIYFDDLMDETATLAALSSSPELPCVWQHFFFTDSPDDKDLGSAFACRSTTEAFQPTTTYTITVSTEAKDTSGHTLHIGTCLSDPGDPPCPYEFSFTTLTPPPPTGNLQLDISGLPTDQKRVRVIGPDGFDSGLLDSSTTFSGLPTGNYTITATGFVLAPGKPACRSYTPTPTSQTETVIAGESATASVIYEVESCAPPPDKP